MRKFGKEWNEFVEGAGLRPKIRYDWTKEEIRDKFLLLLREGRIIPHKEAINLCEELPSAAMIRSLFGSHKKFWYFCGVEAIRKADTWFQWEFCCERIARHLYGEIDVQQLDVHVKGRPDIVVPSRKLIIDAMTAAYAGRDKQDEIARYSRGHDVEFWCLWKLGTELPGVRYRYAEQLLEIEGIPQIAREIGTELLKNYRSESFKKELLDLLRRHYQATGDIPKAKDLRRPGARDWGVYKRTFGSFPKALELAGIPQRPKRKKYTNEDVKLHLQTLYSRLKRTVTPIDFRGRKGMDKKVLLSRFGSFEAAFQYAGVPFRRLRSRKTVPRSSQDAPARPRT